MQVRGRIDQNIVGPLIRASNPHVIQILSNSLQVEISKIVDIHVHLPAGFEKLHLNQAVLGQTDFVRIQDMKNRHVMASIAEASDAFKRLSRILQKVRNNDHHVRR